MPKVEDAVRIATADFEALGVLEDGGRLYLPTSIRRRNARGGLHEEQVLLTAPTTRQRYRARSEAFAFGRDEFKLDPERDKEQFSELENYAILSFAIRDPKTRSQLEPNIAGIIDRFLDGALAEVWGRLNAWVDTMDPRYGELTNEQLWQVVAGLAAGNLFPLVAMPTYAQSTCFALMAREALLSPNVPSWLRSPATSNSAPSTETSSPDASVESTPTEGPSAIPDVVAATGTLVVEGPDGALVETTAEQAAQWQFDAQGRPELPDE